MSCNLKYKPETSTEELKSKLFSEIKTCEDSELIFEPINDTFYYFADKNVRLNLFKYSFLNKDSSIYAGKIKVNFSFEANKDSILKYWIRQFEFQDGLSQIFGLIKFSAQGADGEPLIINPVFQPSLSFPEYSGLMTESTGNDVLYHILDTQRNIYSTKIMAFKPIYKLDSKKKRVDSEKVSHKYDINLEFTDTSRTYSKKSKNNQVTTVEPISYELSLITLGQYYIGWNDALNLTPAVITINIENIEETVDNGFIKVLLFTHAEISKNRFSRNYNYYLVGKKQNKSTYFIDKTVYMNSLQLPLDRKFDLFIYGINNGNYYYYMEKNIKLNATNKLGVKLAVVSEKKLIKVINDL